MPAIKAIFANNHKRRQLFVELSKKLANRLWKKRAGLLITGWALEIDKQRVNILKWKAHRPYFSLRLFDFPSLRAEDVWKQHSAPSPVLNFAFRVFFLQLPLCLLAHASKTTQEGPITFFVVALQFHFPAIPSSLRALKAIRWKSIHNESQQCHFFVCNLEALSVR